MEIIILLNIIVIILAYLSQFKKYQRLFDVSFLIIFLFTALRFNFGTDYINYHATFVRISDFNSITNIDFQLFNFEPSWAILNYIFKPFGFFVFIFFLSAFLCYTYYYLIRKHVSPDYYWLAMLIYVFSIDIMWIQFSALRQALAIAIFIHSIEYITEKKRPIIYIIMNIIGSLFHSSALFMLPLVIFSIDKIKKSKYTGFLIIILFWSLLIFGEMLIYQIIGITSVISGDKYQYTYSYENKPSITLIGSIAWGTLLFIIIYYSRIQKDNIKNLFYISSLHNMVYVVAPLVWLTDRMGFYFAVLNIIVFPYIMQSEKNRKIKLIILIIYFLFLMNRFYSFLKQDWFIAGYSDYSTILPEIF